MTADGAHEGLQAQLVRLGAKSPAADAAALDSGLGRISAELLAHAAAFDLLARQPGAPSER